MEPPAFRPLHAGDGPWNPLPAPLSSCMVSPTLSRRTLLLCATTLAASASLASAASDPAALITAIYKRASAGKGDSGGQFVWLRAKSRPRWLSASLVRLWAEADAKVAPGDEGPPGFDPVTNSQDPMVRAFAVVVERQDGGSATVAATFGAKKGGLRGQPTETVRYDLVRERGVWKIDDIRGTVDGKAWSIRKLLREEP
jgi:hypothetical protein